MRHKFNSLIITLAFFNAAFSQTSVAQDFDVEYWEGWYETPLDVVGVGDWEQHEWITATGIVAVGMLIYSQDERIRDGFQSVRSESTDGISKYLGDPLGNGLYSMGFSAAAYGIGWMTDDPKLRRTSIQAVKAYILTGGATYILKQLTHRPRPYEIGRSDLWYGPTGLSNEYDAFPSGHTSTAFAVASVYAHSYSDQPWVGITAYSLATFSGLSRINDDYHWASDVFFGAAFGWYIGKVIVENDSRLTIAPTGNGIYLSWRMDD